jgi:peptidoglycan/LPS O-acetylase OafA/YrhL
LLVALGHCLYLNHLDPSVELPRWLRSLEASHNGVLIFFVLSGFLISLTNAGPSTPATRRAYLWRRFVRLAPIYYLTFALTVGVLLFLGLPGQKRAVVGAFLGLQNFNDYFSFHLPPPGTNGPLWSLNYELLYYVLFLWLWRFSPGLGWVFVPALGMAVTTWFAPQYMPLFLGSYACGWLFWAAGWWLAKQPDQAPDAPAEPVLTWLLHIIAGYHLGGSMRMLNALGWYSPDAGMVSIGHLGMLPAVLLLMSGVTRRQLPGRRIWSALAWFFCLGALAGVAWTGRLWDRQPLMVGAVIALLAVAFVWFHRGDWLRRFASLGKVSYAFYLVHFPLLFVVQRSSLPSGTYGAYFLRLGVWAVISLTLACLLELHLQPWIKRRLTP